MAKYEVPADVVVISVYAHQFHVHSDNAMIDSGSGFIVHGWNRATRTPVEYRVHTGWGVVADWCEENDRVPADSSVGVLATDFADALRRVTGGPDCPKFYTNRAACHNEFRRPFGGR